MNYYKIFCKIQPRLSKLVTYVLLHSLLMKECNFYTILLILQYLKNFVLLCLEILQIKGTLMEILKIKDSI